MLCAENSITQINNVPINTSNPNQAQPTIAVSPVPDYEWLLCATWVRVYIPPQPSTDPPTLYTGWAISFDRGESWGFTNYFLNRAESSVQFDRHGALSTSIHCISSEVRSDGTYGKILHNAMEDFVSWSAPHQVSSSIESNRDPKLAIDNKLGSAYEGRLYATWTHVDPSTNGTSIRFRYSTNRGLNWSTENELAQRKPEKQTHSVQLRAISMEMKTKKMFR